MLEPNTDVYGDKVLEKEQKQRSFADELKKQIEERDYIRKKEEWRKTRFAQFVNPSNDNPNLANNQVNP